MQDTTRAGWCTDDLWRRRRRFNWTTVDGNNVLTSFTVEFSLMLRRPSFHQPHKQAADLSGPPQETRASPPTEICSPRSVILCLLQTCESEWILLPHLLQQDGHHALVTRHLWDGCVFSAKGLRELGKSCDTYDPITVVCVAVRNTDERTRAVSRTLQVCLFRTFWLLDLTHTSFFEVLLWEMSKLI